MIQIKVMKKMMLSMMLLENKLRVCSIKNQITKKKKRKKRSRSRVKSRRMVQCFLILVLRMIRVMLIFIKLPQLIWLNKATKIFSIKKSYQIKHFWMGKSELPLFSTHNLIQYSKIIQLIYAVARNNLVHLGATTIFLHKTPTSNKKIRIIQEN